jgi:hypothetical protein
MRDRVFYLLGAPVAIVISAAVAYGLVFLLPKATGYDVYDFASTFTPSYSADFYPDVRDLKKLQPEEFQAVIAGVFDDLVKLPEEQLYMLSALDADDVCRSKFLECLGVPGKNIKPFIEKALSHKQTRTTTEIAASSLDASRLSLAVAFAAFLVSVIALFLKKKA